MQPASVIMKDPNTKRIQQINSFKALAKMKMPQDQNFSVLAYSDVDVGQNDKKYIYNPLGSYKTEEDACKAASKFVQLSGHSCIIATKTGQWKELKQTDNPKHIEHVSMNSNITLSTDPESTKIEHLMKIANEQAIAKEMKVEEERRKIEQELLDEEAKQTDPKSYEFYTYNTKLMLDLLNNVSQMQNQCSNLQSKLIDKLTVLNGINRENLDYREKIYNDQLNEKIFSIKDIINNKLNHIMKNNDKINNLLSEDMKLKDKSENKAENKTENNEENNEKNKTENKAENNEGNKAENKTENKLNKNEESNNKISLTSHMESNNKLTTENNSSTNSPKENSNDENIKIKRITKIARGRPKVNK